MTVPHTQLTLLGKLRDAADDVAWQRFEHQYRELVVRFAVRQGLQSADAEDVAQAVFAALSTALRGFVYDRSKGRFRDYLFRATRNEIARVSQRNRSRPTGLPDRLSTEGRGALSSPDDLGPAHTDHAFEEEWKDHHFRLALVEIRATHSPESVAIFERLVNGGSVESTAAAFATTPAAVHKVKQRIRDRMRELIARQIAEEEA